MRNSKQILNMNVLIFKTLSEKKENIILPISYGFEFLILVIRSCFDQFYKIRRNSDFEFSLLSRTAIPHLNLQKILKNHLGSGFEPYSGSHIPIPFSTARW
jgi:hypothetical protein